MVLPSENEISQAGELDIACIMRTATEVGGDYYDIIKLENQLLIGIGDVTGHGLTSGLVMLMAQTAIRALTEFKKASPNEYLTVLNRVLYANISRIKEDRSMTLMLMSYNNNKFVISGQHESIIICRKNGEIEVTDTVDSGFYVGMTPVTPLPFKSAEIRLEKDDVLFLYTDGVTEAEDSRKRQFGMENLCLTLKKYHNLPAEKIKTKFMKDLYNYMGETEIYDDISLVVIKQK
jgi:serine phosphatase RsbU (regulator of sigma subunit)